ncbi:restriction endonuclease subunit S [uncultured Bilophila sp.]|uniref:restriction endonuclease subunit S n=1 Tax=uncultured Bilophila sp. TaxID=529385 RepID=UPI002670AB7E|nr:restriction endonuclease subunit S [uncultured Bilophila sp.]
MSKMKMMSTRDKKKDDLVPRLRFPEFMEEGEWIKKKIYQFAKIYKGKGISKADISKNGTPCIRYGEVYTIYNEIILQIKSKTSLPKNILFLSKINDVIIPASGETKIDIATASCVMKDNVALGGDLNIIRTPQNGIFISYYLNGNLRKIIAKIAQGDTVVHLYPSQIGQLDIAFPTQKEQKRIADCLSSLDERIAAETNKLDTLKDHKKGLLKQLFPAEGETLPQLRFPEFGNSGKWQKIALGDICDIIPGYTFPECLQGKIHGLYPFCKVSDISKAVSEHGGLLDRALNYVGDDELSILKAKPLPVGTTVFAKIGEALRLNRRAITTVECLIDNNAVGIKAKSKKSTDYFLYTLSQLIDLSEYCGGAVPSVSKTVLENIAVVIPTCSEQQRITNCLSSLDELIAAQTQKINLLKDHKKGLMQQLFPCIDEVRA